ncbi:glycerophosphodiester phosphodiesterase family protein [Thauera humireducens]|uniref:glycerophosphodiester phosphodiesterase family protein n=1 Tax=Thauera humireducens TaxID=1134435 RepID=UPI00311DBA2C
MMQLPIDAATWPYPRWIAHRGAGQLAPENTLAAFRLGHAHGYRMFECDVRLSADGVPFLLHDDVLDRTTDGKGVSPAWTGRRCRGSMPAVGIRRASAASRWRACRRCCPSARRRTAR